MNAIKPERQEEIAVGAVTLHLATRTVTVGLGKPVRIIPKQSALLALLMRQAGTYLHDDRMMVAIYGDDWPGNGTDTLKVHISLLRKALTAAGATGNLIERRYGFGFRFVREPDYVTRSFPPATWARIAAIAEREGIAL